MPGKPRRQGILPYAGVVWQWVPFASWSSAGACKPLTPAEKTKATALGFSTSSVYPVVGLEQMIELQVNAGSFVPLGIRYESGTGGQSTAARFRVISVRDGSVRGGATYVLRRR